MTSPRIGTGVMDVVFDPKQIEQAGKQQLLPSAKRVAADVASVFAAGALLNVGVRGLEELKAAEAAQSNVAAVIKSTGGAANVTAEQVDQLADSQLKLTGVDDEIIKQGAAKLLTFKQVQNQVGDGNAVFDRATKASLDLAQLGFGSVESASVLLGKALNDPVKGLTALQRVGVALTESQKEQVKALVASGDVLGAQKVILAEVESQVGGAAEAYGQTLPGKIAIAEQSLANMEGALVAGAAPALEIGAEAVEFLADKFQELPEGAQQAIGGVVLLGGGIGALVRPIADVARIYEVWRNGQQAAVAASGAVTAAQGAQAAATAAVTTNSAASVASLYAQTAATEGLAIASGTASAALGPVGLIGAAAAAAVGLVVVGNAMGGTKNSAVDATSAVNAYSQALDEAGGKKVDPQRFIDEATLELLTGASAPEGLTDVAQDLQGAGIGLNSFFGAVRDGTDDLGGLASNTEVAKRQANALINETKGKELGDNLRAAAEGGNELAAGLLRARESGKLTDDRILEIIKTANDLSGGLDTARTKADVAATGMAELGGAAGGAEGAIDGVNDAALEGPDTQRAEALANWYDAIKTNADEAFAATLQLAPADIRAQEGAIAIANANDKVAEAEETLANLRRMGTPEQIIDAERDLESARLDQQQAVLSQADALAELANQQQVAATGTEMTAEETEQFTQGALSLLNTQLTGPTRDAIAGYIWQMEIARQKVVAWRAAQTDAAGFTPPGPDIAQGPDGQFDPRLVPPRGAGPGPFRERASGGDVLPGEVFRGGEQGWEVLMTDGLYQAPPQASTVLDHSQSVEFMGAVSGGRGGVSIANVNVYGDDAPKALRRLPDELRAAAFLAGV